MSNVQREMNKGLCTLSLSIIFYNLDGKHFHFLFLHFTFSYFSFFLLMVVHLDRKRAAVRVAELLATLPPSEWDLAFLYWPFYYSPPLTRMFGILNITSPGFSLLGLVYYSSPLTHASLHPHIIHMFSCVWI